MRLGKSSCVAPSIQCKFQDSSSYHNITYSFSITLRLLADPPNYADASRRFLITIMTTNMAATEPSHHRKPNLRWDALTPTIITTTLATAVVVLRLVVRCKFVKAVGFDDFVITMSLVSIFRLLLWKV